MRALIPTALSLARSIQGKKQAGRLQALAGYHEDLRATLGLLGLWAEQPQHVLQQLRQLALVRWGGWDP